MEPEFKNPLITSKDATTEFMKILKSFISLAEPPIDYISITNYVRTESKQSIGCAYFVNTHLADRFTFISNPDFPHTQTIAALMHSMLQSEDLAMIYNQDMDMWFVDWKAELYGGEKKTVSELRTQYLATQAATASLNSIQ